MELCSSKSAQPWGARGGLGWTLRVQLCWVPCSQRALPAFFGGGCSLPTSKKGLENPPNPLSLPRPHLKAGGVETPVLPEGGGKGGGVHAGLGANPVLPSEPEELRYRREVGEGGGWERGRHRDAIVCHADVHEGQCGDGGWGRRGTAGKWPRGEGTLQPAWVKQGKRQRWGVGDRCGNGIVHKREQRLPRCRSEQHRSATASRTTLCTKPIPREICHGIVHRRDLSVTQNCIMHRAQPGSALHPSTSYEGTASELLALKQWFGEHKRCLRTGRDAEIPPALPP